MIVENPVPYGNGHKFFTVEKRCSTGSCVDVLPVCGQKVVVQFAPSPKSQSVHKKDSAPYVLYRGGG